MRIVIVTGISGSGKTAALKFLEDEGYFCVDNLPLELIGRLGELAADPARGYSKIAIGFDARSLYRNGDPAERLLDVLKPYTYEMLFLDCRMSTLFRRFKTTRRLHPLQGQGRIENGIFRERELLEPLRQRADVVIDTSELLTRELKEEVARLFGEEQESEGLFLSFLSFGYKYGIPSDADLVFDVRFLPNPFYEEELKHRTGNDKEVQDYVCQDESAEIFIRKTADLLEFLIPRYKSEGKRQLIIAVGCTGGKHRSVTMANRLSEYFERKGDNPVALLHRDITK